MSGQIWFMRFAPDDYHPLRSTRLSIEKGTILRTPQISGGQIPDTKQHDIQARPLHLDVRWLMLMAEAHHLKCHPKLSIA
jgi:hypothetical protein